MGPQQQARVTMAYLVVKRSIRPDVARSQTQLAACTRASCTGDINDVSTWIAGDSQLVQSAPFDQPFRPSGRGLTMIHYDALGYYDCCKLE